MTMATILKEREIELSSGKLIVVHLEVDGIYDADFGADADGARAVGRWLVDSHSYEFDTEDELTEEEESELVDKVEEIVYESVWDFENADNFASEDDEPEFF